MPWQVPSDRESHAGKEEILAGTKIENGKTKSGQRESAPIRDFTDLVAWQVGRELRRLAYRLSRKFPVEERTVLTNQMRRAAISVTANLAEGYGRYSYQENSQFCRQSRASAYELRDHFLTGLDENYIDRATWQEANDLALRFIQIVNGYIRSTQKLRRTSSR
jgi:four helix bundle protein